MCKDKSIICKQKESKYSWHCHPATLNSQREAWNRTKKSNLWQEGTTHIEVNAHEHLYAKPGILEQGSQNV